MIFFLDFVSSNTVVGDGVHPTGAVEAEIVKANIPIRNGVVHLISRPLMVVDNTVKQFIEVSVMDRCYIFIFSDQVRSNRQHFKLFFVSYIWCIGYNKKQSYKVKFIIINFKFKTSEEAIALIISRWLTGTR